MAPYLAESWAESEDGLTYEFLLRQGLTFHDGDPFAAEEAAVLLNSLLRFAAPYEDMHLERP
jgi:peptide/nickel transport system substrate-binding protein